MAKVNFITGQKFENNDIDRIKLYRQKVKGREAYNAVIISVNGERKNIQCGIGKTGLDYYERLVRKINNI